MQYYNDNKIIKTLLQLLQISSTCPVCVTYEARSKFVITSLRPAFAKIYPSSRPDLAVETFFHARPGSPLLRGITDDDFITWFDKTELASLKTKASIDNICECGRICSRDYEFRKSEDQTERNIVSTEPTTEKNTSQKENAETTTSSSGNITRNYAMNDIITNGNYISTAEPDKISINPTTQILKTVDRQDNIAQAETISKLFIDQLSTATSALEKTTALELDIVSKQEIKLNAAVPEDSVNTLKVEQKHTDDPIIVPTAIYTNRSNDIKIENNISPIVPKSNGELIVQKIPVSKIVPKKEEYKKKQLPRRKGTLKATYGDKENMFLKTKMNNHSEQNPESRKMIPQGKEIVLTKPVEIVKAIEKSHSIIKFAKIDKPEKEVKDEKPSAKSAKELKSANSEEEIKAVGKANKENTLKVIDKVTQSQVQNMSKIEDAHIALAETSTSPHTIAAITNSNIKNIHYRTKKPKAANQIKKPSTQYTNHSETKYHEQKNDSHITEMKINKTKMKSMIQEKYAKTIKSINKEIHKLPPTPISETSKTLAETPRSDIAPENKGGFEILDKNRLWELLKEGSDEEAKLDDKLQVHNRIILAQNMSKENRSL